MLAVVIVEKDVDVVVEYESAMQCSCNEGECYFRLPQQKQNDFPILGINCSTLF